MEHVHRNVGVPSLAGCGRDVGLEAAKESVLRGLSKHAPTLRDAVVSRKASEGCRRYQSANVDISDDDLCRLLSVRLDSAGLALSRRGRRRLRA